MTSDNRFQIQDAQYHFPYHWLPQIAQDGSFSTGRSMGWGLEYLTYMQEIGQVARRHTPRALLDLGCGDGRLSSFLPGIHYTGVDLSEKAIHLARCLNPDVRFLDVAPSENGQFDLITAVEVIEHVPDGALSGFFADVSRMLAPGGILLISVPTSNRPVHRKHYRHYDINLLRSQLATQGFEIMAHRYVYRIGFLSTLLTRLLCNKYWTLNQSWLTRVIWNLHRRGAYVASADNGAHLIAEARRIT